MSKTILVIDDEADVRAFLTTLLQEMGYRTVTANNGLHGLDVAKSEKPDLITLDLAMPDQTGTEFYKRMSRDKDLSAIPIIVISGLAGRNLAVKSPIAVFDKPIDAQEFIDVVQKALGE
jgi:CheY-like chemotaxis protein